MLLIRTRALAMATVLAIVAGLFGAMSAFANAPTITAGVACDATSGQFVVSWTVKNNGFPTMTITAASVTMTDFNTNVSTVGSVSGFPSIPQAGVPLPDGSSLTGTTTLAPNFYGSVNLTVTGNFDTGSLSSSVFLPGGYGLCSPTTTTQTIAGHIYDCTSSIATTTEVPGGTLGVSGPQSVATQPNPLNPTNVAAGNYSMSAGAPSGYQFVTCGGSATVGSPPTSATETVNVPGGGAGVGIFYVSKITQTIAGHIYDCTGGTATSTEVAGGALGATGPQTVTTQPNPLNPTSVAPGTYTMGATAPSGYQFVQCGSTATINSASSATESVTVPSAGSGVGFFYVTKIPTTACTGTSTIGSNFNGTPIAAGDTVWFSAVVKVNGLGSAPVKVGVTNASITFTSGGTTYTTNVPDSQITFSSGFTSAQTTFNGTTWVTTLPPGGAGNTFLTGVALPVPSGLPGGINPVTWKATFTSDTPGITFNWQWAAAAYTNFGGVPTTASYGTVGAKPVDDNQLSAYKNSDHAGTPESFKSFVTGGARGGGGSNFTGSYSGTASPAIVCP